jgi:hypothetical protein
VPSFSGFAVQDLVLHKFRPLAVTNVSHTALTTPTLAANHSRSQDPDYSTPPPLAVSGEPW